MTKSELITELAEANPHLTPADAEKIIDGIFRDIGLALARGDRVQLRGFGHFTVRERSARMGRNPKTGQPVKVHRKVVPFFKVGRALASRVANGPRRK